MYASELAAGSYVWMIFIAGCEAGLFQGVVGALRKGVFDDYDFIGRFGVIIDGGDLTHVIAGSHAEGFGVFVGINTVSFGVQFGSGDDYAVVCVGAVGGGFAAGGGEDECEGEGDCEEAGEWEGVVFHGDGRGLGEIVLGEMVLGGW